MRRSPVVLILILMMALPAGPAAAGDQKNDFDTALKAAETNRKSDKGFRYEGAFVIRARSWLGPALYTCTRNLSMADARPLVILVRVSDEGKAEEVLVRPMTKVARCLKPRFVAAKHPKPPGPSWWVKMELSVR
jgi:hypothetical protein